MAGHFFRVIQRCFATFQADSTYLYWNLKIFCSFATGQQNSPCPSVLVFWKFFLCLTSSISFLLLFRFSYFLLCDIPRFTILFSEEAIHPYQPYNSRHFLVYFSDLPKTQSKPKKQETEKQIKPISITKSVTGKSKNFAPLCSSATKANTETRSQCSSTASVKSFVTVFMLLSCWFFKLNSSS